jgi:serine/threonine protein kinase/ankyrin repeat protein
MSDTYLRKSNAEEPLQRLMDVAEPPQPLPIAIALELSSPPPLESNLEARANHLLSPEIPPTDTEHHANDEVDDVIAGRYRIVEVLGEGGVGITYRATDLQTGQPVALKALSLKSMQDWKQLELFEREAQTLKQLDHPGIPKYLDYFHVDTAGDRTFYIVQQLAEGESLAELVKRGWRSTEAEVKAIAEQLLNILAYLHRLEPPVIHRDIKPQNIIRGADGRVFLVDFGAVQNTYYNTFMRGSTVVGTFGYMAPEQFRGQAVPATDFYGLAATLLFLLTWRSPADIPQDRLRLDFRSRVQISDSFADWLEQMLEPDFDDRFSSAQDALESLRDRRRVSKFRAIVPWKTLVGVSLAAVALVTTLDHYRWAVLRTLGFGAPGICGVIADGDIGSIKNYVSQGGNLLHDSDTSLKADDDALRGLPLICAFNSSNPALAKLMISRIAGVNGVDEYGLSPLHWAVVSKDMTQQLLLQGADVNAISPQFGSTPLHRALSLPYFRDIGTTEQTTTKNLEYAQVVRLLIDHGADVNIADEYGQTPLLVALSSLRFSFSLSSEERKEIEQLIELLIRRGAEVNVADKNGETPLSTVLDLNNAALAEMLLRNGADPNVKLRWLGNMPLHAAVQQGNFEIIELLLRYGAHINAKNDEGKTPLQVSMPTQMCSFTPAGPMVCTQVEKSAIAALLKRYGAIE